MRGTEVRPFEDEHLEEAAGLLAARHASHRAAEQLLPARFEDPAAALEELAGAWRAESASGAVALRDGRLAGYLIGAPRRAPIWGANVWVELAGHAVSDAELVRDLYGLAAERWVEEGRTRHSALVPATDPALVDAWFRVGFGQQHALGICEVSAWVEPELPADLVVRRAGPDDVDAGTSVDVLAEYQTRSPVFSGVTLLSEEDVRAEWIEALANPEEGCFLAERDGRPVGALFIVDVGLSSMHVGLSRPDRAAHLGYAATVPDVRGSGAGLALTNAGFAWAREQGYPTMVVDWRVTNLLSSRFWPARGFRTTFLRLYRSIP